MKSVLGRKVVTIGGGHGGSVILKGLYDYPVELSAICAVSDSGGSTGLIRDEFGDALPSGDIRLCMEVLSPHDTMRELLGHRFEGNGSRDPRIADHNLGNLILLAAQQRWGVVDGIVAVSTILRLRGRVLPVSTDIVHLVGELSDGVLVRGESGIDTRGIDDSRTLVNVWLEPEAFICREATAAIAEADLVVIGPGDLYTSLIPNLLVNGVADALASSKARIVYVANVMTKWAETRNYTVADFAETVLRYGIGRETFDAVLVNATPIPNPLLERYHQAEKATPVLAETAVLDRLRTLSRRVVCEDFLSNTGLTHQLIRHDSGKVGRCLMQLFGEGE